MEAVLFLLCALAIGTVLSAAKSAPIFDKELRGWWSKAPGHEYRTLIVQSPPESEHSIGTKA